MKRVVLLSVFAIAAIAFWSCRKDVIIKAPPSLAGDYVGTYCVKEPNQDEECQEITVRFTADQFIIRMDPNLTEDDRKFCDFDGKYELGVNIVMAPRCGAPYPASYCLVDSNATQKTCAPRKDGYGTFFVDQSVEGRLVLESVSGDMHKIYTLELI